MNTASEQNTPLINALLNPAFYDHPVSSCQLIETHISWVILTGDFAYKVKKPVDFGFLDFSSLQKRKYYCEEELRLNRRLAPNIYLDVVAIVGTPEAPSLTGPGNVIEYAVKMAQFSQQMQLDHVLARNELQPNMIDAIANLIAAFHQQVDTAGDNTHYGDPEHVRQPIEENFVQIRERVTDNKHLKLLSELKQWSEHSFRELQGYFIQRKLTGFIRECHGDLHLRNLAWYKDKPLVFDCLEFNQNFRWIDVLSEVAFLVMDLQDRDQPSMAYRFLNRYLELTGDYEGISVLRFYLVYRAMVRAKVDAIRAHQPGLSVEDTEKASREFHGYLRLALTYTKRGTPYIIITCGMSASGKSTLTQPLLEKLAAIRIRSDVERKRLYNIMPGENSYAKTGQGIYTPEATNSTYLRLVALAGNILDSGFPVIIDAAFPEIEQRNLFRQLATGKKTRCIILEFIASNNTLRQRIRDRKQDVSDADLDILEDQIRNWHPLEQDEQAGIITIDTERPFDINKLISQIESCRKIGPGNG